LIARFRAPLHDCGHLLLRRVAQILIARLVITDLSDDSLHGTARMATICRLFREWLGRQQDMEQSIDE
jgi:hypothetical protein